MKTHRTCLTLCALLLSGTTLAAQFTFTTLHHFGDPAVRGAQAEPLLVGPGGVLYGVTRSGGTGNGGLLYRLSADGSVFTVLRQFGVTPTNGTSPVGAVLVGPDGFLYGGTEGGGTNGTGVIYRVDTNGANYSIIYHAPDGLSGRSIFSLINGSDDRIYGGVAFVGIVGFDPGGANFQVLPAGGFPQGGCLFEGMDGRLYAVEPTGGNFGDGLFYRVNKNGSNYTLLRASIPFRNNFLAELLVQPLTAFQDTNGTILGLEYYVPLTLPGSEGFYVFKTDTNGTTWTEAGLTGGLNPAGLDGTPSAYNEGSSGVFFRGSDGAFYGSLSSGGTNATGYAFKFHPYSDPLTNWQNVFNWPANFSSVFGALKTFSEGPDQKLYGVTSLGGRLGGGAVFRLNRDGTGFTQLHNFTTDGDGTNAAPPVIVGSDGRLYGTTVEGGRGGRGTIFRHDPATGDYRVIGQFNSDADGIAPQNGVLDGQDGFLYGVTTGGGSQNLGTLYRLRFDGGGFTVLYNIRTNRPGTPSPIDPASIADSLVMDTNGWLYGVGTTGGSAGRGGIFRARKDGSLFTNIHNFIVGEARRPVGGLVLALDGKLYGTTENGGANDAGVLYRLNPDGSGFQILRAFGGGADGLNPIAPLWQDTNGVLFGTTFGGGSNNLGTVFSYHPVNTSYAVLHHFGPSPDGRRPSGGLVGAPDGSLVGATRFGGSGAAGQQLGTLFKLNPDGSGYEVLRSFTGTGGDGESHHGTLARGVGNIFYGSTSLGGNLGDGTVFQFTLGPVVTPLTIAPTNVTLRGGQTQTFSATGGTPPYTFGFAQNDSGGTMDPASGLYTAGPTDTVLDTVRVTDSLAATALATVAVAPLNLVITAATPPQFLAQLTHIDGNLTLLDADTRLSLLLPRLTHVTGDLIIQNNDQLQTLDLSSLRTMGGSFIILNNASLTNVSAGTLKNVTGEVEVSNNTSASTIDLSSLTSLGGDVTISSNAPNATTDLSDLKSVGDGTNAATITLASGTFVFTNGFTVPTNATLNGHGTLAGSVTNTGVLAPGSSLGQFHVTGHLVLGAMSRLQFEIAGSGPGQAGFVSVAGGVTLGGTLSITLLGAAPLTLADGAEFALLIAGSPVTGAFANVTSGGTLTTTEGFARFTALYAGAPSVRLTSLALVDTDGDRQPDAHELAAGTDPANPASVLRILSVAPEMGGTRLTWTTETGRSYVVQTNGDLARSFADFRGPIPAPGGGPSTTNLLDPDLLSPPRHYRIRLGP
jgi:uncharacterized repeat protein (TIGR03803 family)